MGAPKSIKIGYYTEKDLVDPDGKKLETNRVSRHSKETR
jgi:hypothetical protein